MTPEILRDDRAKSFLQIGDLTTLIAEKHCGLTVDITTQQRWRELFGLLREFDTLIDDTDIDDEQALLELENFSTYAATYPSLSPLNLPDKNRRKLMLTVDNILQAGHSVSEATSPDSLIINRVEEGRLTARLLEDSAQEETTNNTLFESKFMPVMRSLGVTACLLDSLTDSYDDYSQGKIATVPSIELYSKLAYGKLGFQALAHIPIMKHFSVMSMNRLQNRLTHGSKPYSSLRIINQ